METHENIEWIFEWKHTYVSVPPATMFQLLHKEMARCLKIESW